VNLFLFCRKVYVIISDVYVESETGWQCFAVTDQHSGAGELSTSAGNWLQQIQQPLSQRYTRRWRHTDHAPCCLTQRTQREYQHVADLPLNAALILIIFAVESKQMFTSYTFKLYWQEKGSVDITYHSLGVRLMWYDDTIPRPFAHQ